MVQRSVSVKIAADTTPFVAGLLRAERAVKALTGSQTAAAKTTKQLGSSVAAEMKKAATAAQDSQNRIAASVTSASKRVKAAREAEEDAARKVKIQELQLQEMRDRGKAKASQTAAAEDRLLKSRRALTTAQDRAVASNKALDATLEEGIRDLKAADRAADQAGKSYQTLGSRVKGALGSRFKDAVKSAFTLPKLDTTAGLRQLGSSATKTGRDVGTKLGGGLLGAAGKVAGPLALIFGGAAIASGFGKSISLAATFDKSMRQVGVSTKQTGDDLKSLTDLAIDMGAKTTFSAQGASDAMLELAKGGLSAAQIKAGALASTLTLATAGGLDLGAASSYMVQGLTAFGLEAKDSGQVAAALAGAANASTASVDSLGQALSQVGPGAKLAGLSLQDTTAALAAFDNAGIKGSDAGTSLKTFLTGLVPDTLKTQQAFADLGLSTKEAGNRFFDAEGKVKSLTEVSQVLQDALKGQTREQKIATLQTLFGSDASRAAAILAENGAKGLEKYTKATNDKAAAEKLAKSATDGYSGALEKFRGSVETAQIQFGTKFLPILTAGLDYLSDSGMPTLQGISTILTDTFAPAISGASGGIRGFIEYLSTHQTDVIRAFQSGGNAVFDFGKAVAQTAADGLRQFGDFAFQSTVAVLGLVESLIRGFDSIPGVDMSDSIAEFDRVAGAAKMSAANTRVDLYTVANGIEERVIPSIDAMKAKFNESAETQIVSAQQRDALANTATAIGKIGTQADGTQVQVKKFSDISKLSADKQKILRGQIDDAKTALANQLTQLGKTKGGQEKLTEAWKTGKDRLYDEFVQMGLSKKEAGKLATEYAGVKPKVSTKFETPGLTGSNGAISNVKALGRQVGDLQPVKTVDIKVNIGAKRNALAASIYAAGFVPISGPRASDGPGRARGGILPGFTPVSQGDDQVIPMRSGEGVEVSEAMRDPYEVRRLHTMNRKVLNGSTPAQVREDLGEGYATGGVVGNKVTVRATTSGSPDLNLPEMVSASASLYGAAAKKTAAAAAKNFMAQEAAAAAAAAMGASGSYSAAKAGKYGSLTLSGEQLRNAAVIASVGSGMGQKAIQVGLITAIQESMLRSLSGGDRDSVGLFQQRAPWGSKADRMNPRTSAGMFYHGGQGGQRGLDDIRGWQTMGLGGAAQAVQVSAFPGAYTKWIDEAQAIQQAMASSGSAASGTAKGGRAWPTTGRLISTYAGHDGVDINKAGGDYGEPIYAYRSGVITHAGPGKGYGNAVFEQPDVGPSVVYGHGSKVLVREGQRVTVGQQIAKVGSTGNSSGDHLHFGHPGGTYSQAVGMLRGLAEGGVVKGGSGGVTARVGEGKWDELVTPLPPGWNMTKPDSSAVQQMIAVLANPLRELVKATRAVNTARARDNYAKAEAVQPRQYLYDTTKRNVRAKVARDDLREDVTALRKKAAATKGQTRADWDLAKAEKALRAAEILVTKTGEKRAAAQEQFTVYADRSREATERLKAAQQALADQQQAVADSARAASDSFAGRYINLAVTDPMEIVAQKKAGAAELAKFNAQIQTLRRSGLNEDSISEIVDRGPVGGGELAIAILSAGQGLIKALNGAQANLTRAADNIGLTVATGVQRKARGGWVIGPGSGTSDSIDMKASNGEFYVNAVSARANAELLERVNASPRKIVERNYAAPSRYTYGGGTAGAQQVDPDSLRPIYMPITMPATATPETAAAAAGGRVVANLQSIGIGRR